MALFAEVRGFANDVITPFFDLYDPVRTIRKGLYLYKITYGYGIGATDTTDAEIAFDMAFHIQTIVYPNDVTATRRFDDETSH